MHRLPRTSNSFRNSNSVHMHKHAHAQKRTHTPECNENTRNHHHIPHRLALSYSNPHHNSTTHLDEEKIVPFFRDKKIAWPLARCFESWDLIGYLNLEWQANLLDQIDVGSVQFRFCFMVGGDRADGSAQLTCGVGGPSKQRRANQHTVFW